MKLRNWIYILSDTHPETAAANGVPFHACVLEKELISSFCIVVISAVFPTVLHELIHAKHQRMGSRFHCIHSTSLWGIIPRERIELELESPVTEDSIDPGPSTTPVSKDKWPNVRNGSSWKLVKSRTIFYRTHNIHEWSTDRVSLKTKSELSKVQTKLHYLGSNCHSFFFGQSTPFDGASFCRLRPFGLVFLPWHAHSSWRVSAESSDDQDFRRKLWISSWFRGQFAESEGLFRVFDPKVVVQINFPPSKKPDFDRQFPPSI